MTDFTDEELREYRHEAERTKDDAYPHGAPPNRPRQQRAKVLSVRLNPAEFDELTRYADALEVPASALVRGWILDQLRAGTESATSTVDRIARDIEQLRRQLAA